MERVFWHKVVNPVLFAKRKYFALLQENCLNQHLLVSPESDSQKNARNRLFAWPLFPWMAEAPWASTEELEKQQDPEFTETPLDQICLVFKKQRGWSTEFLHPSAIMLLSKHWWGATQPAWTGGITTGMGASQTPTHIPMPDICERAPGALVALWPRQSSDWCNKGHKHRHW